MAKKITPPEEPSVPQAAHVGLHPVNIAQEMREAYLDYAMSVITSRALPDARDGLKPVHRRILFSMNNMGLTPGAKFRKATGEGRKESGELRRRRPTPGNRRGGLPHDRRTVA
jgi:DNA gyrase subunit A